MACQILTKHGHNDQQGWGSEFYILFIYPLTKFKVKRIFSAFIEFLLFPSMIEHLCLGSRK